MKKLIAIVAVSAALASISAAAVAQEGQLPKQAGPAKHATVELSELLEAVGRKSDKEFLVDRRVAAEVVIGTVKLRDIDYAMMLTVLRNNGLAAAPAEEAVRIVPVSYIRQYDLPILMGSDDSVPDDAWVTRIITIENAPAVKFVSLLRPMIQQAGHLVADADANMLVLVAPYSVTERLAKVAIHLDNNSSKPAE